MRTISTNFGFSFGLPFQPFRPEPTASIQPPTKRRKSEEHDQKESESKSNQASQTKNRQGTVPVEKSEVKGEAKPRRRFESIPEEEPPSSKQTEGNESFTITKPAPGTKKRGRTKKTKDEGETKHESGCESPPKKKRGGPKKAQTVADESGEPVSEESPKAKTGRANKAKPTESIEQEPACESPPRKKATKPKHSQVVDHVEALPAETSSRPRRRAAVSASVKVTEGFAEEEAPIDKKRRDPALEPKKSRGRKPAKSAVAPDHHEDRGQENELRPKVLQSSDPPSQPLSPKRKRQAAPPEDEDEIRVDIPMMKRKQANPLVGNSVNEERCPKTKTRAERKPLRETNSNANIRSVSPEKHEKMLSEENISPRKSAQATCLSDESTVAKEPSRKSRKGTQSEKRIDRGPKQASKSKRSQVRADAASKRDQYKPSTDVRNAFLEETTKQTSQKKTQAAGCPKTTTKGRNNDGFAPAQDRKPLAGDGYKEEAASVRRGLSKQEERGPLEGGMSKTNAQDLKKTSVAKAHTKDGGEEEEEADLDWLLQEPANSRKQPRSTRSAASSRPRKRQTAKQTDDMDLDDLLQNIANFVPPSLRVGGGRKK